MTLVVSLTCCLLTSMNHRVNLRHWSLLKNISVQKIPLYGRLLLCTIFIAFRCDWNRICCSWRQLIEWTRWRRSGNQAGWRHTLTGQWGASSVWEKGLEKDTAGPQLAKTEEGDGEFLVVCGSLQLVRVMDQSYDQIQIKMLSFWYYTGECAINDVVCLKPFCSTVCWSTCWVSTLGVFDPRK